MKVKLEITNDILKMKKSNSTFTTTYIPIVKEGNSGLAKEIILLESSLDKDILSF